MAKDRLKDLSELLSAYLDGELEESARAEVVAYLDRDAGAVRLLNELRETRSMLQNLPHQSAPAGFSEGVVSAVERQALLGGEPETTVRMSMRRRWGPIRAAASIALLVGVAGSWIYWQSNRREFTDLALQEAVVPETSLGRATDRSLDPMSSLARVDDTLDNYPSDYGSRTIFKNSDHGKAASLLVPSAEPRSMVESAEMEDAKQQQQSIVGLDLKMQAGELDEEVVMLEANLDTSTWFYGAADAEQVDFGLAGQLRGSRRGGAVRADFTQRLRANEPAVSLARYDFSNESNVLTLNFSSDAQRDEFTQKLEVYLMDNSFLSATDPLERIQVVEPLTQNVLLRGRQGLNYTEPRSEQILLNAAPEVLEGLIDRYAETIDGLEDTTNIQLQMGKLKVEGLKWTRRTVQALAVPELQRRMLGKDEPAGDGVQETAADQNEQRTAEQWREHYARLGLAARMPVTPLSDTEERAEDESGSLEQSEGESAKAAAGEQSEQAELKDSGDPSPARPAGSKEAPEPTQEAREEAQAVAAGKKDQGVVGVQKKTRRARSAKGMRADDVELFGGLDKSPPTAVSVGGDSRARRGGGAGNGGGGGRGGGGIFGRPKNAAPSRLIGRASNLTFVLKLQTMPPARPEPEPEMGPPAPPSESDDSEE